MFRFFAVLQPTSRKEERDGGRSLRDESWKRANSASPPKYHSFSALPPVTLRTLGFQCSLGVSNISDCPVTICIFVLHNISIDIPTSALRKSPPRGFWRCLHKENGRAGIGIRIRANEDFQWTGYWNRRRKRRRRGSSLGLIKHFSKKEEYIVKKFVQYTKRKRESW